MIAGGFDDISEEGSYEFANMKATSNAETEFAMGREPTEMSRPATTTRAGVSFEFTQSLFTILIWSLVHGSPRYWRAHCHECQDCSRTGSTDPWYSSFHIYFDVSILNISSNQFY